jgi:hypothetical protein
LPADAVAAQTVTEVRFGAFAAGWGERLQVGHQLDESPCIVDHQLVEVA